MKNKQCILLSAAIAMLLCLSPLDSVAQWQTNFGWRNNSGNLPGTGGDGYLIAAGVAVVGVVAYVIIRNKKKKARANSYLIEIQPQDLLARSFYDEMKYTNKLSPAELLVSYKKVGSQNRNITEKELNIGWQHKNLYSPGIGVLKSKIDDK